MHRPRLVGGLIVAILTLAMRAYAQSPHIPVALQVTEETGGLIESAFRTTLRALGDVNVVTVEEHPYLIVRAVVQCNATTDDCETATTYSLSIQLTQPFDSARVHRLLRTAVRQRRLQLSAASEESLASAVAAGLWDHERRVMSWAASWGRDVYPQAVRDLVAEIDSKCLERERIMRRAVEAGVGGDNDTAARLVARWEDSTAKWFPCR